MPVINNYLNEPNLVVGMLSIRFSPSGGSSSFSWIPIASSSTSSSSSDATWTSYTISRTIGSTDPVSSSWALTTSNSLGISPFINRNLAYNSTAESGFLTGTYTLGGFDRSGSYWTETGALPLAGGTTGGGFVTVTNRRLGTVVPFVSVNAIFTSTGSHVYTYRISTGNTTLEQNTGLTGTGPVTFRTEAGGILGFGVPFWNTKAVLGVSTMSGLGTAVAMMSRTTTSLPGAQGTSHTTIPSGFTVITGPANIAGLSGNFVGSGISIDYKANGIG